MRRAATTAHLVAADVSRGGGRRGFAGFMQTGRVCFAPPDV